MGWCCGALPHLNVYSIWVWWCCSALIYLNGVMLWCSTPPKWGNVVLLYSTPPQCGDVVVLLLIWMFAPPQRDDVWYQLHLNVVMLCCFSGVDCGVVILDLSVVLMWCSTYSTWMWYCSGALLYLNMVILLYIFYMSVGILWCSTLRKWGNAIMLYSAWMWWCCGAFPHLNINSTWMSW